MTALRRDATSSLRPCLRVEALCVNRGQRPVLRNIHCVVPMGQMVAVLGANGAGKSTLLAAVAGELPCQSGRIMMGELRIDEGKRSGVAQRASQAPPQRQARRRAVLPQQASVSFPLQVQTVVGMGLYPFPELSASETEAFIQQALLAVELGQAGQRFYATLSGGEQQRVQFARVWVQVQAALARHGHAWLLMDEPVANLDPGHQHRLLEIARGLAKNSTSSGNGAVGVLVVLHDLNLAARWCDGVLLLKDGCLLAAGTPAQVLAEAVLEQAYGMRPLVLPHPQDAGRPLVLFDP